MANFDKSSDITIQLIRKFILNRMKDKNISQPELSEMIGINKTTLMRNLSGETEMSLSTFLKICEALELRPYLIPSENDSEMAHPGRLGGSASR